MASPETRPVAGAWDDHGRDVRALLAKRDHQYVRDFKNLSYAGFANLTRLRWTLDPGPRRIRFGCFSMDLSSTSARARCMRRGRPGFEPEPPSVEAQMPDGSWKRVIDDMGFPAGFRAQSLWI